MAIDGLGISCRDATPPTNVVSRDGDMRDYPPARHLKRRAAVLIDVRALPVRAPSTTSSDFPPSPTSRYAVSSCEPEPPEARADPSSEGCKDAKALRQFSGRMWVYSVFLRAPEPPEARTGSLGEISEEGGTPTPLTALTRGQREVLRAHLSGKGLIFGIFDFADPKLPEASAGFLGEECGTDGIPRPRAGQGRRAASPLTPDLVIFTNPNPPEACARTLGEG
ncbi:hypothetical protein EV121DRAFT_287155 [Schizophyllum commune]